MDAKQSIRETLAFQDLTEQQKSKRGILGRLYGPCASIVHATRNGRKYSDELWERVFTQNEIVKEMLANGGIPMQLDHPIDREETDSTKIAAMLPQAPKRDKDGHLICYIDIIDTPCGRIAYQLAKYGFNLGISSRGTGDLYTDENGDEAVDPQTYEFTTFDLVLLPAVKDARMTLCRNLGESLKSDNFVKLKKALKESYNSLTDARAKQIMAEQLGKLNIRIDQQAATQAVSNKAAPAVQKNVTNASEGADDTAGAQKRLLSSLKQAIREKGISQQKLLEAKQELAVADSKVLELQEQLTRYKEAFERTSVLAGKAKKLIPQVERLKTANADLQEALSEKNIENKSLREQVQASKQLTQSVDASKNKVKELQSKVTAIEAQKQSLTQGYQTKLQQSKEQAMQYGHLARKYKEQYETLLEQYIETKASMLNVRASQITKRLDENFKITDIDVVCDQILNENLQYSKLPFNVSNRSQVRIAPPADCRKDANKFEYADGYQIDDMLLSLAGLK